MVSVNCAALPSELIESELFGHEKGAFTGATAQRKGRFELADNGTIFLDEIGELTAQAQAKLLRILQQQSFERVGGSTTRHVNVRVIAATNRDLAAMVKDGRFRDDLYYRLNVFPIRVPPLREHRSDIPLLARHFLHQMARKLNKPVQGIDKESLERLMGYSWPGNVRELQNAIERATIVAQGPTLSITDPTFRTPRTDARARAVGRHSGCGAEVLHPRGADEMPGKIEGRNGAAAMLNVKPSTLRYRMRKLGIEKADAR